MIDMHSHVLPLVDDGSQDMQESLEMIQQSAESGVKILVVTPHANQRGRFENYYRNDLKQRFRILKQAVEEADLKIRLVFGMEIYASPDLKELIDNGFLTGLNCSDYYLVEFPFEAPPGLMYRSIDAIFRAGGIPVIAHPERYTEIQKNPGILYEWIQEGACTQINKGSVFGSFGTAVKRTAEILYEYDLVTCVGSDAHGTDVRTTDMSILRDYLERHYGPDYMKKVTRDNAFLMLKNQDVPVHGKWPMDPERLSSHSRRRFHSPY